MSTNLNDIVSTTNPSIQLSTYSSGKNNGTNIQLTQIRSTHVDFTAPSIKIESVQVTKDQAMQLAIALITFARGA